MMNESAGGEQDGHRPPKFSIVIPVYNVAPYLRECLDSVLAQTYTDWEAICVDDGSTDGSGAILDEYAAKDNRFRVIHRKNAGVGAARNAALDAARGEWVCFLDADDVWHREFLSDFALAMEVHRNCKLFRCGMIRFLDGAVCEFGQGIAQFQSRDVSQRIEPEDFSQHYFWEHVYRHNVIGPIRFPRYIRGEDRIFFNTILLERCNEIVVSETPRYGYRQRQGSAMNSTPRAEVLVDELEHRRDLVLMIEASKKQVDYAGSWWLERYFTDEFGALVAEKSAAERAMLWDVWLNCVREMKDAKGLSAHARHVYCICCRFPYRPVVWLVARAYPWYMSRGIIPRGFRKIRRLLMHI